jgi:hypothetical protein
MGNMDRTSEKWKMIGGNLALVQVSKMIDDNFTSVQV